MSKRLLVAYASGSGSTAEVAEAIAEVLRAGGATVEVQPAKKVRDVRGYDAVVLGSGIRAGKLLAGAEALVKSQKEALAHRPVAYFVVCLTMCEPTEEKRAEAEAYLDPLRQAAPEVEPVGVGLFAGAVNYRKLALPMRWMLKAMKVPEGDFRDWNAIRSWAESVRPALLGE